MDPSCAFKYFIPEPEDPGKHKQKASRAVPSWAARSTHACAGQAGRAAARALALLLRPLLLSAMPSGCPALPASVVGAAAPEKPRGRTAASAGPSFPLLSRELPLGWASCWSRQNQTREGKPRAGHARVGPGRGSLVLASREPNPGEVGLVLVSRELDPGGKASCWSRENRT